MASRVKLRRTDNSDSSETRNNDWSRSERVSELCARDPLLRDALHAAQNEGRHHFIILVILYYLQFINVTCFYCF
ncbi:hypothetical protein B5X24_HaOG213941 [Helicoverpa armigera]|uniref:Uncharacterized protein n=1 Tax=Helicoverpa armigera TaxID=29058 RepID=A0A2W1B459_HELAM|nr:hypothetical protein B5X24_HaOG213941 [Helicoverpa armigera]